MPDLDEIKEQVAQSCRIIGKEEMTREPAGHVVNLRRPVAALCPRRRRAGREHPAGLGPAQEVGRAVDRKQVSVPAAGAGGKGGQPAGASARSR